ncbi:hypothetical protein [Kutzneria sp. NPDC052558]|uniref:hypothetical protein n=1 Tax=Kutzneria sp. NPDC052558 TaxID=3364121 RepID=UPI0037CB114B
MTRPRPTASTEDKSQREVNAGMVARFREMDPQPYVDGSHVLRVVTIPGRVSGEPRPVPIAITKLGDRRYLCSPSRSRDWAANLAAAGRCTVEGDDPADYTATQVDGDEAVTALHTYLGNVVRLRGAGGPNMWPFPKDAPAEEIRDHLDQVAVFRLV